MAKKQSSVKGSGYSAEQSKAAQQMADAMEKMARFAPSIERSFITQADVLSKMTASMQAFAGQQTVDNLTKICDALKCISDNIGAIDPSKLAALGTQAGSTQTIIVQMTESVKSLNQNIQGIDPKSINRFSDSTKKAGKQVQSVTKNEFNGIKDFLKNKFPIAAGAAGGALSGLVQGFRNLMGLGKGIFGFISTLTKSLFKIGTTLLSIPFKIFDGLINMADQGGGGISELAEAINGMRKEFGALSGPTNSAIMGTAKAMGHMHIAGTSALRVFGNQADRLKMLTELYAQSGSNLRGFAKEIQQTGGAALALQKGLGLTAENMESFAARAKSTGQPITKMLTNVTKQADQMGKAFGLDAKIISKEMGKAAQDFKNFGNVSEKQLAVAVTYAEKLGLKLDKITGTMDAFGTFDDAADNVSKLNEAFGTNIDAMEILQAQSPEEKMEILRREMRKAGVEGEKLNAAQRKLIAGAAGMDDQTSIAAFSTKNYGVSLSNIKKEGDKAEKKTLTQAEAIDKLADAMERMLKSGESGLTGGKGLLGAFLNGISRGIQMHPAFITAMRTIKATIFQVFAGGVKVGQDFVDMFPGIKGMLESITKVFNPQKVAALMEKVRNVFKEFFTDLSDPTKKGSVSALMTRLKETFFNFFNDKSPEGNELLGHFGKFKDAVIKIFSEIGVYVIEKLSGILTSITEWIRKPVMPKIDTTGTAAAVLSPFEEVAQKAGDLLWPAIKDLGKAIWEKLKEALMSPDNRGFLNGAMATIAAVVLGPALVQGLAGGLAGGLAKKVLGEGGGGGGVMGMVKDIFAGGNAEAAVAEAAEGAGAAAAKGGASFLESPAELIKSSLPDEDTIKSMEAASGASIDWAALTKFLLGMAGLFAIGLGAFKVALEIVKGVNIGELGKAALLMGVMMPVIQKMSELIEPLSEIKDVSFSSLIKTLLGIAAIVTIGLGAFWVALRVVKGFSMVEIIKAGAAVYAVSLLINQMPEVFLAIKRVSKTMDQGGGPAKMAIGLGAIALTIMAIAATAWVAIKMVGKFSLSEIGSTVAAVGGIGLLMFGAAELLTVATLIGSAIGGAQALLTLAGLAGMGLVVLGVAALAKVAIKMLGRYTTGEVTVTLAIIGGMQLLLTGAAALIGVASATGAVAIIAAPLVVTGFKAMDKAIMSMAKTATNLINLLGKTSQSEIEKTQSIMTFVVLLFTAASVLIHEAALIGMFSLSWAGNGGKKIEEGMKSIVGATEIMSKSAMKVIKELADLKEDPAALKLKGEAFSAILESISSLMDSIKEIIDSMSFSFFESSETQVKRVESVGRFVEVLISGKAGNGGIKGLIDTLLEKLKDVPPENLERAKVIAEILAAAGSLIQAMVSPALTIMENSKDFALTSEQEANTSGRQIKQLEGWVKTVTPEIKALIVTLVDVLKGLNPVELMAVEKGGPIISQMLSTIGNFAQIVKPGDLKIQNFSAMGATGKAAAITINQTIPTLAEVFEALADNLPMLFDVIVGLIEKTPVSEQFEKKAVSAAKLFEVLVPVIEAVKALDQLMQSDFNYESARIQAKKVLQGIEGYLDYIVEDREKKGGTISGVLGEMNTLGNAIEWGLGQGGLARIKDTKTKVAESMQATKETIEALSKYLDGDVPDGKVAKGYLRNVEGYLWNITTGKEGNNDDGTINGVLGHISTIKRQLDGSSSADLKSSLELFNAVLKEVASLSSQLGSTADEMVKAKGNTEKLKSNFSEYNTAVQDAVTLLSDNYTMVDTTKLDPTFKNMEEFGKKLTTNIGVLSQLFPESVFADSSKLLRNINSAKLMIQNGILPAAQAVNKMVEAATEIQNAISNGATIDIDKKLKLFSANSSKFLGTGGKYTVTTKDVNINVNFKVVVDAEQLASTIVQNKNSVIRQRINLLLSAVPEGESSKKAKEDAAGAKFTGTETPSQLTTYRD